MKQKKYYIIINKDSDQDNAKKEQFRDYQRDGETVMVAIGVKQEVPQWVAERAKEVGDVEDYFVVEE